MEEIKNEKNNGFFDGNPKMIFGFGIVTGVALALIGVMLGGGDLSFGAEPVDRGEDCPGELCEAYYFEVAEELELNMKEFATCYDEEELANKVSEDQNMGLADGVGGTPATIINGIAVSGALPYETITEEVNSALEAEDDSGLQTMLEVVQESDHIYGDLEKAKVVMLEYSDLECPYCGMHHETMMKVMEEYGDDVAWIFRHFPLPSIHPEAESAALASECAGAQVKFWEFQHEMFTR